MLHKLNLSHADPLENLHHTRRIPVATDATCLHTYCIFVQDMQQRECLLPHMFDPQEATSLWYLLPAKTYLDDYYLHSIQICGYPA